MFLQFVCYHPSSVEALLINVTNRIHLCIFCLLICFGHARHLESKEQKHEMSRLLLWYRSNKMPFDPPAGNILFSPICDHQPQWKNVPFRLQNSHFPAAVEMFLSCCGHSYSCDDARSTICCSVAQWASRGRRTWPEWRGFPQPQRLIPICTALSETDIWCA